MFGAADFDMFGGIRPNGASNPVGAMLQTPQMNGGNTGVGYTGITGMNTPQVQPPQAGGGAAGTGLGFNIGTGQLVLGGIQAIGNLWAAWEAQKLAREQFDFTKGVTNTNLGNSIQSYNTQLSDRINSRAFTEGRPEGYADKYIEDNRARDLR